MSRVKAAGPLLLAALILFALTLRSPIVAVSGVLGRLIDELGLTEVTAGALTTIPVLAFAVITPFAARLLTRVGADVGFSITLAVLLVGTLVRSSGGAAALLAGTALIGLAITLGNLVVPMLVHRDHAPGRRATVTGLYAVALNVGTMSTLMGTAPLEDAFGWRVALVAGVIPIVVAAASGVAVFGWRRLFVPVREAVSPVGSARRAPWRVWLLALSFGAQAFMYYGLTAWLPELLAATRGMSVTEASAGSSLFQIFAVAGGIGVPLLVRVLPYGGVLVALAACWMSVPSGLLFAPDGWFVWLAAGGIAQGGFFTLVFVVLVQMAPSAEDAARWSAVVQCIGYGFGALGPSLLGGVFGFSGAWVAPLYVVLAASVALAVLGMWAVRGLPPAVVLAA